MTTTDISNTPETKPDTPDAPENLLGDLTPETPAWRAEIPDEYQDYQVVKNAKSVGDIVKSLVHAQSMVGKDKLIVPDENATEEQWADTYNKLGRPESHDKYEFQLGEGGQVNESMVNGFKEAAYKSGLSQRQANDLMAWYGENSTAAATSINKQSEEQINNGIASLREEWGSAFDAKVKFARAGAGYYEEQIPALKSLLDVPEVGSHPGMLKLMAMVGERVTEGKIEDGGDVTHFGVTPQDAQAKINKIIGNYDESKNPYYNKDHADHERIVEEVQKLTKIVSSTKDVQTDTF